MPTVKKQNLLLAAFAVLIVIFGSISAFELVKGPTSTTITSSTTFTTTTIVLSNVTITETETVEHYITNQFYRTTHTLLQGRRHIQLLYHDDKH
ncbi:MAG: hypothetical protein ABSB40_08545 [Nitrososphaeria archaeon]